jgi:hypothetical protein
MGFLKKITRPISRALDKIIPNEVKPALPFLAAAAPFMAPGLMGLGGNTMLSRALMSGGLNLGAQLAQEGSEGDFSGLSTLMAAATGALSTPGSAGTGVGPAGKYGTTGGTQSAGDFFKNKALGMDPGFAKSGLGALETSSNYLSGVSDTLQNNLFSMEGLKAASIPFTQGTTDLVVAENRRAQKDYDREMADYEAGIDSENSNRAFAIRQSMEAYGFTEQEILDAIEAAGYANGGRVGYAFGDLVRGSSMVQPAGGLAIKLNRPVESGDPLGSYYPDPSKMKTASPIMPSSGMGEMLSNLINSNPQIFSNLTGQTNNSVSNMSRDFIDLNQNGIDDRQEKAYGGRVGLKDGGRVGFEFGGIPAAVESVEEKPKEFLVDKLKVTVQPGQSEQMAIMNAMMNDIDEVMPEDRKMEFYKLYLPQLRASGEISEKEYQGLMGELFGEGKAEGGRIGFKDGTDENLVGIETLKLGDYDLEGFQKKGKGNTLMFGSDDLKILSQALDYGELSDLSDRQKEKIKESIIRARAGIINPTELNSEINTLRLEPNARAFLKAITPDETVEKVFFDEEGDARIGVQKARQLMENVAFGGQKNPSLSSDMYNKLGDEYIQDQKKATQREINFNKEYNRNNFLNFKDGGLMNLGGREMDMRTGGFIPIGKKERADDVPARLSKNEFVMTADAVRAAGGGSVNEGARRMYNLMNNLEARV